MDYPRKKTWNVIEKAKHSTWARIRGMSKNAAMLHYTQAVQQLKTGGSATTTSRDDSTEILLDEDMMMVEGAEGLMGNTNPSSMANNEEDNGDGYKYQGQELTLAQQVLRTASQNNVTMRAVQLEQNPELANHRDKDGQSALHLTAEKGAAQALELLLQAGADGNAADADGITCLQATSLSASSRD
jgi:hypothetical protein